jgi:DNA-binding CsgD family transcriptional regulator/GAF domain-containing protein
MKISINELTLQKVFEFSAHTKKHTAGLSTVEDVCQSLTQSLYQTFSNSNGQSEFALCRIFKSCSFGDFPKELKTHIRQKTKTRLVNETKHIALLGTFGETKEWCSISNSKNHKALPLNDPNAIKNFPMMLALFNQIGFEISQNQKTGPILFLKKEDHDFGLFLVEKAEGNSLIPDQEDFVIPLGIKSVFGFGGMFSTGNIFAVIIFSKKRIKKNQAEIFHSLVPAFKYAQVKNELKGRIFKGIRNNPKKNKISEKIELEVEKEKADTLNEELIRANKALLNLNDKLYRKNFQLNLTEERLNSSLGLLRSIQNAQAKYIIESCSNQVFDDLLGEALNLTESQFGFIGEILNDQEGKPYLKTQSITNIAWNKKTRKLYEESASLGMEFHNLDSLFGEVITTGKPVISNDPLNDPRSRGFPKEHPPLKAFLGLPFDQGGKTIGMVGMANRPEGYNEKLIDYLQPFLFTCSNLLQAWRNDQQRKKVEWTLKEKTLELEQKNLALKEILAQIEIEKNQLIKTVSTNVNKLLIPSLQKLAQRATRVEQKYITLLKKNLKEITSGLGPHISDTHLNLSPRELEVFNMVSGGLNTKEISSLLNLSIRTVETHRFNIRKKLQVDKTISHLSSPLKKI